MKYLLYIVVIIIAIIQLSAEYKFEKISEDTLNKNIRTVFFLDDNLGWAAGQNGKIIKTTDGGYKWKLRESETDLNLLDIYFINKNNGWIVGGKGDSENKNMHGIILNTNNGGYTWNTQFETNLILDCISFVNDTVGYVGSSVTSTGIYKTTDGGVNWTHISITEYWAGINKIYFINDMVGYLIGYISFYPMQDDGTCILKTTDGGNTWDCSEYYEEEENTIEIYDILFINDKIAFTGTGLYHGPTGSIMKRDSMGNWTLKYKCKSLYYKYQHFEKIYFTDWNHGYAFTTSGLVFETYDNGETWKILIYQPELYTWKIFINGGLDNCWAIDWNWDIYDFDEQETGYLYKLIEYPNSIDDNHNSVKLYPNPANDILIIECEEEYFIQIIDIYGNEYYSGTEHSILTDNYPNGYYICIINTGKERICKNFVVVN